MRFQRRATAALTRAIITNYLRSPLGVLGGILGPILFMALIGFLTAQPGLKLAVVDHAHTSLAGDFVSTLQRTRGLGVEVHDDGAADKLLRTARVSGVLVIPPRFGQKDADGKLVPTTITETYDPGQTASPVSVLAVAQIVSAYNDRVSPSPRVIRLRTTPVSGAHQPPWALQFFGLILTWNTIQVGLLSGSAAIAGYKAKGALRRIQASPVRATNLIVAQALSSAVIGTVQVVVLVVAGAALLKVPISPLPGLVVLSMIGLVLFLSMGMAATGTIADTEQAASVTAGLFLVSFLPLSLPQGEIPVAVLPVVRALPSSLLSHAMQQVGTQGAALWNVPEDIAGVAVWIAIFLVLATRFFRWD